MSIYCPCREPKRLAPNEIPTLLKRPECCFSVNELLFCTQCRAVRCPFCTTAEPVVWFCSKCLAEFTKSQARSSSNRCSRDCVRCPNCLGPTSVSETKNRDDLKWAVKCTSCDYAFETPKIEDESLAQTCRNLRNSSFDAVQQWVVASFEKNSKSPLLNESPISTKSNLAYPELVPLRARYTKRCRQCRSVLVEPELGAAKFEKRDLARPVLPHLHLYNGNQLLLRNFSGHEMIVKLAGLDVSLSLAEVRIPPLPASTSLETAIYSFPAPLFLMARESVASRQAAMAQQVNGQCGAGWSLVELDRMKEQNSQNIYIFCSISSEDEVEPLGAWFRLDVQ